jgi:DNA-directed RNA polymerase specialized sigma24 family protein
MSNSAKNEELASAMERVIGHFLQGRSLDESVEDLEALEACAPAGAEKTSVTASAGEVTQLLHRVRTGDASVVDDLFPLVYHELKKRAAGLMFRERKDHTLQTTVLVDDAFFALTRDDKVEWANREHFFALASRVMWQSLREHAERRNAVKRGGPGIEKGNKGDKGSKGEKGEKGGQQSNATEAQEARRRRREPLDAVPPVEPTGDACALMDLVKAIEELEQQDVVAAAIVQFKYLSDLTISEIAERFELAEHVVKTKLAKAKAMLKYSLKSYRTED